MQRFFVDFGTGTSIDNVYFVTSVDSNISREGYKTDVKMSFGEGFATYRSLNQKLAMMAANWADATRGNNEDDGSATTIDQSVVTLSNLSATATEFQEVINEAFKLQSQLTDEAAAAVQKQLEELEIRKNAAIKDAEAKVKAGFEAQLDESTRKSIRDINEELSRAEFAAGQTNDTLRKAQILAEALANAERLAASLPGGLAAFYLEQAQEKVKSDQARAKASAAKEKAAKEKAEKEKAAT
jgi:hypothetical protein